MRMLRIILQWPWGFLVITTAILTFPGAVEEGVVAWGRWGRFAVIYLFPYLGPWGMLIPLVLGVFWLRIYYPPALFNRLRSGSDNCSSPECPAAEESEFPEENIHENVAEAIRRATTKKDSSKIFYTYMEPGIRPDEKDAVAACIVRNMIEDMGAGDLSYKVDRLANGMDHVLEEDKHRYSMDVLGRVGEMLEESPPT